MKKNTPKDLPLNRREVLKTLTLIIGYTLTAGSTAAFLAGCKAEPSIGNLASNSILTNDQLSLLAEACERILPKTNTPGAKDAHVAEYIANALKKTCKASTTVRCTCFCTPFWVPPRPSAARTFGAPKTKPKPGKTGWCVTQTPLLRPQVATLVPWPVT